MNILLVGGAGYVGGAITHLLSKNNNFNLTVLDSLIYEESYRKEIKFIKCDIRNHIEINKILPQFDIVIWMAALVGDGACEINKKITLDVNVHSVKNLVDNFNGKIIFFSTCSVYGYQDREIDEDSKLNPLSTYAKSKIEAEEILKNANTIIFRLGTLFGISDIFSRIRMDLVVNLLVMKSIKEKKIKVYGGEQYRPLLHVKDVARAVETVLINKQKNDIYNLSYKNYKIIDLAKEILLNFEDVELLYDDQTFQDNRNYRVSSKKFNEMYNFNYNFNVKDGVVELKKLIEEERIVNLANPRYSNVDFLKEYLK
ncbi:MAG: NAD-dependent dehydratase [Porticoccus sp.]|nr:NAD-dependent dehydratase [Porticoccus sp.]